MTHTQCALCWINPVGFHAQDVGDGWEGGVLGGTRTDAGLVGAQETGDPQPFHFLKLRTCLRAAAEDRVSTSLKQWKKKKDGKATGV